MRRGSLLPVIAAALLCGVGGLARAQDVELEDLPMPTDRDFAIDIYQGAVLGSVEIVGMGGVAVATARGSAGMSANPASPAVRAETSTDTWDWDFHVDWLSPDLATDFDNNGIEQDQELQGVPVVTGGLVGNYKEWALGVGGIAYSNEVPIEGTTDHAITSILTFRAMLARSFWEDRITAGLGIVTGTFDISRVQEDEARAESLFSITGSSLEAGAILRPHWIDIRAGVSGQLPISGDNVNVKGCDPLDCNGYVLPERASLPWKIAAGLAWRRAETRWNRPVRKRWRDERYMTVAADVLVTGATSDGFGMEAFSQNRLQAAGRSISIGVRSGIEYEWVPGWFRIRGGSYYEPSRYQDAMGEDISGRVHLTLGLDVRVWSFGLWGERYRVRLSLTSDGAEGYANGGLSIGFWH